MTDFELMGAALEEARKAAALGEVPVGAVVAKDGEIISAAHNTRETEKNALHHAELLAIDAACKKLGGWRLWQCELFVTLEPCPMCSGGIINSRIRRVELYQVTLVKSYRFYQLFHFFQLFHKSFQKLILFYLLCGHFAQTLDL